MMSVEIRKPVASLNAVRLEVFHVPKH